MVKIIVNEMPDKLEDGSVNCPFARPDREAAGFGTWHWCGLINGLCDLDYGKPCSHLAIKDKACFVR